MNKTTLLVSLGLLWATAVTAAGAADMTGSGSRRPFPLPPGRVVTLHRRAAKMTITLRPHGEYYVNGVRVPKAEVLPRLRSQAKRDPNTIVTLKCDQSRVPQRTLLDILDSARQAGLVHLVLREDDPLPQKAKPAGGTLLHSPARPR